MLLVLEPMLKIMSSVIGVCSGSFAKPAAPSATMCLPLTTAAIMPGVSAPGAG
ncbi:hypothetical protein WMF12_07685 [Sorangium sp. So ce363]